MEFYPTRDQVPAEKAGTDYTKLRKSPRKFDQSQMGYECYSMECRMPLQDIPHFCKRFLYSSQRSKKTLRPERGEIATVENARSTGRSAGWHANQLMRPSSMICTSFGL